MVFKFIRLFTLMIFSSVILLSCSAPGASSADKRTTIDKMRQDVLSDIYRLNSSVRSKVSKAPGYAVFSNVNINLIFISAGSGYGVMVNNATGKKTYMKMGEAGFGFGAGVKDFRALFIFNNKKVMNRFLTEGWQFGAQADAAAKAGDKGKAVGGEAVVDGIEIYQLTETGLALQATVKGTKYWIDGDLN